MSVSGILSIEVVLVASAKEGQRRRLTLFAVKDDCLSSFVTQDDLMCETPRRVYFFFCLFDFFYIA